MNLVLESNSDTDHVMIKFCKIHTCMASKNDVSKILGLRSQECSIRFLDAIQAIMAEGKEHAVSVGTTKLSTEDM